MSHMTAMVGLVKIMGHVLALVEADAVLAGDRAAGAHARLHHLPDASSTRRTCVRVAAVEN
jgi:hypothetical protein